MNVLIMFIRCIDLRIVLFACTPAVRQLWSNEYVMLWHLFASEWLTHLQPGKAPGAAASADDYVIGDVTVVNGNAANIRHHQQHGVTYY